MSATVNSDRKPVVVNGGPRAGEAQAARRERVLVSVQWLQENLRTPGVRVVEISVDTKLYAAGHIPGAVELNWNTDLQDQVRRDIVSKEGLEALLSARGIVPSDTIVLYGDHSNWFAAYAFWLLKIYGHADVRLLDGGRARWLSEKDGVQRPLTTEVPAVRPSVYTAHPADTSLRAHLVDVLGIVHTRSAGLVDVRSPDEFTGKVIAPPGMSETAQRAGHVPGAVSVPWGRAVNEDGTFKSDDELRELYRTAGINLERPVVTYCRIGERSSHSWFVLRHLLGVADVRNYDGSWTEYGSVVGVPIER